MMRTLAAQLPPAPSPACRVTVVIPARDEVLSIAPTLAALATQRTIDDRPLPTGFFDVIVFANNCSDDTAAVVRSIALKTPALGIRVIEDMLPIDAAHIGTARKYVMDIAAARFAAAGMLDGIIASLDSDTIADRHWVAAIAHEMEGRDAVAGHVTIAQSDVERLLAPVRLLYARELTYRRVFAEVESLIDPLPENPQPLHGSFVGASFAVTTRCYLAAGGLPPLRRLEDLAFLLTLRRIDARIRHSSLVRATTSARLTARVDGGFGTFITELHACARRGTSFTVEHPLRTLEDLQSRAALRRIRSGHERDDDRTRLRAIFNVPLDDRLQSFDPEQPFGTLYQELADRAQTARRQYPPARVEVAIATLRATATALTLRQQFAGDAIGQETLITG